MTDTPTNNAEPDDRDTPSTTALACLADVSDPDTSPPAPAVVYLLADHLDAVLARGEDLLAIAWRPERLGRCPETIAENQTRQRELVDEIRTQELALVSRALKARERSRELAARDGRFGSLAKLFAAATSGLLDAAQEAGDATDEDFETGDGIVAYLRGRGLVAPDACQLDDCGAVVVTEDLLVARRIPLGGLLDLVGGFLDALEIHYEVYPGEAGNDAASVPVAPLSG